MRNKRLIVVFIIITIGSIAVCFSPYRDKRVSIIKKGDCYQDRSLIIKENFRFLFRVKRDGDIYVGFVHVDTSAVLVFKNDHLSYIGNDIESSSQLGGFKDVKSGRIYKINYRSYMNPVRHMESLIDQHSQSKEQFAVNPNPVESCGRSTIDWGLTFGAMVAKMVGVVGKCARGGDCQHRNDWEYDYGRFPLGSSRKHMLELIGNPTYVDGESGVEYYDQYGLLYANDIVEAIFSPEMLDYRITCKYAGLEFQGTIDSR